MSAAARRGSPKTPFLRTSNVLWDEIDLSVVDEMAIPSPELAAKTLRRGDLLVCEGGEIGRSAIWEGELELVSFQNHLHRLRPVSPDVEPRFYVYFLQSAFTQLNLFEGAANRTTIPNLSRSRLAALEVPVPKRTEQAAIGSALRVVRQASNQQRQIVRTCLELRRAAMRTLFTRGLRGELTKETEVGTLPRSWTVESLGQLDDRGAIRITMGQSPPSSTYNELGIGSPFFQGSADFGPLHPSTRIWCDRARKFARAGDTLLSVRAPVGDVNVTLEECGIGRGLASIAAGADFDPWFVYFVLAYRRPSLVAMGSGSTFAGVSGATLRQLTLPAPAIAEQEEIASTLRIVEQKTELHRRKVSLLEQLFKTLLHDLMTGRIRVDDLDLPTVAAGLDHDTEG